MIDLEKAKKRFERHKATLTDYGNIKILDFKVPDSNEYRIRFLFEEDYCRLHISGDLGELTATNYNNMVYEKFRDYVNNVGYFEEKINCHNRPIYVYDEEAARDYLKVFFEKYDLVEEILYDKSPFDTDEECIDEFIDDILEDFSQERGLGSFGYDRLSKLYEDAFEFSDEIGKQETGILDLYMLAFKLAKEQLQKEEENGEINN